MSYHVIKNKYSIPGFLFLAVTSWVVSLVVMTVALLAIWGVSPKSNLDLAKSLPWPLLVPLDLCGFYAAFGAFSLYMVMWVYWVAVERSSVAARIVWLLVLILCLPYGATIYAFVVWRWTMKKVDGR